ncbi:hypothetical protein F4778DRAFT_654573 [Xylariomycetidae sp. FL2044]|nr:hypothetical protein F4778DRAFT_654573 [Xylariomycetidae sp. FL2044]
MANMPILTIPEAGLQLDGSASSSKDLPMQAFGITMIDGVIEDMIRCVQKGQEIELTLGNNPCFHFGSKEQKIKVTPEAYNYDLYITNPDEAPTKAERLANPTMSIFDKPRIPTAVHSRRTEKGSRATKPASRASSSGIDSDGEPLGSSHARAGAQKGANTTKLVNGIPSNAKRGGKGKLLPTGRSAMSTVYSSTTTRSLPPSPALNGVSSPNPAFSASQQVLEKNKEQRSILVHELAARDQSYDHLNDVWMGLDADLKPTVEKVANFDDSSKKWSLKKMYWKELDVWNYDYDRPEDRQAAIDNAIKQYDKQRLGTSDRAWERLLAPEERGKGIVLSKLQATLAKGNITPAPRISVQKAEDGSKSDVETAKSKTEAMSRSSSQPGSGKPKKISDREAQTKRLLSTNPKKPAPKKPTSKVKAAEEKGKRVLSEEFVFDSDSTGDEAAPLSSQTISPPTKTKPTEKPIKKVADKIEKPKQARSPAPVATPAPASALTSAPTPAPASAPASVAASRPKLKPKPAVRAPRAPVKPPIPSSQKRAREDDDSSSSSTAPLSKRIKAPKELPKPVSNSAAVKHRASDASQNSRGSGGATVSSNVSVKSKTTSPAKSSPLASSPPTNASDFDDQPSRRQPSNQHHRNGEREQERERGINGFVANGNSSTSSTSSSSAPISNFKKRKERDTDVPVSQQSTPNKKPRVSKEVLLDARKFTKFYKAYESLHHEIAALQDPPEDKLADLLEMRERLVTLKRDISLAVAVA